MNFPIVAIPIWFLYKYCVSGGYEVLKEQSKPLPSFGPVKQQDFSDIESAVNSRLKPQFSKLIGSQMSNATTVTEFSQHTSTMNLIKPKSNSESNV